MDPQSPSFVCFALSRRYPPGTGPRAVNHIPTLRTVCELRAALVPARQDGQSIGLVPTMGALHEGHLSLIRRAREECDTVVVSVFVNPSQFEDRGDLELYPRQEARDTALAAEAGADIVFAPSVDEVYPTGFATQVQVLGLTDRLEGAVRGPEHFRGVTTVVAKLLGMALPDVAYFGQKDAQQVLVIKRLVADLNLPVHVEACPTLREADGLALSSRNVRLDPASRVRARALYRGLRAAEVRAGAGERSAEALLDSVRAELAKSDVVPDYLALVAPDTLEPVSQLRAPALLAVAAHVGGVRLIDNLQLQPAHDAAPFPSLPSTADGSQSERTASETQNERTTPDTESERTPVCSA
jgi:pantoate--beta-alanine ligase